jgi:UDP:flavonoid glycosyltransferase YjiC (YdhE family)
MAVLDELGTDRFEFAFIAQGRSRQLASREHPVYALHEVTYGPGRFSPWSILRRNTAFPLRYLRNCALCERAMDEAKPDLLVVDSDFHCFGGARRRGIPIVSINSSPATVELLARMDARGRGMFFSHHCIERVDRWLQRRYADLVICPVIEPVPTDMPSVRQVPPIVRRQFLAAPGAERDDIPPCDVAVMLSGSGIGSSEIDLRSFRGSMIVLGDAAKAQLPPSVRRIPFTDEPAAFLRRARVVVIQGGFNSVSEVIALRKPAVIVPIPNHAEQFVNAHCAQRAEIGVVADGATAVEAVQGLLDGYDQALAGCRAITLPCDGAARAARLIEEAAGV